jgi:hypothetical protein
MQGWYGMMKFNSFGIFFGGLFLLLLTLALVWLIKETGRLYEKRRR